MQCPRAYASFEEGERGSLEPGKRADLVVLREDLFAAPEDRIASAAVRLTVVNGHVAFEGERAFPPSAAATARHVQAPLPAPRVEDA